MKKLILPILLLIAGFVKGQDTALSPITVLLPVKAIVLYGSYLAQSPTWADRKAPDQMVVYIGSGTQPDSIVTVTIPAGKLASLAIQLYADRYGALMTVNRSIFNNLPSIPGYTALFTQISAKASGNGVQKDAATYVQNRFNSYSLFMTSIYNEMYANGLSWIRN